MFFDADSGGHIKLQSDVLDAGFIDALRAGTDGGRALGDARVKRENCERARPTGRAPTQRTAAQAKGAGPPTKSNLIRI